MADEPTNTVKPAAPAEPQTAQPTRTPSGFLKDATGKPSSMRLMSIVALFASIWFGWITLHTSSSTAGENGLIITGSFLLAAFAPKALQKFIEDYFPK